MSTPNETAAKLTAQIEELVTAAKAIEAKSAGASQTDAQALVAQINVLRERAFASIDAHETATKEIERLITKVQTEERAATPQRSAALSLEDAGEVIGSQIGVSTKTKGFYQRVQAKIAANPDGWQKNWDNRTPLDVLIRGGYTPDAHGKPTPFIAGDENDELLAEVKRLNDAVFLWRVVSKAQAGGKHLPDPENCPLWAQFKAVSAQLGRQLGIASKALDSTDTALFVPAGFSSTVIERYELEQPLASYLRTMMLPRFPMDFPTFGSRITISALAEQTADPESATRVTSSDPVDAKISFTRTGFAVRTAFSYELDADSLIAVAGWVTSEIADAWRYTEASVILDGDTTGTHQDSDVSAGDARKQFKGFRKLAIAGSCKTDIGTFNAEAISGMIKSMGRYGINPGKNVVLVGGPSGCAQLLTLKDNQNNAVMLMGAGGAGSPPVMTTGSVSPLFGMPVVNTDAMRQNLNASGVYDGTTTTKTGFITFNRNRWLYGMTTAAPLIESDRNIETGQTIIVMRVTRNLQPAETPSTTDPNVWYGYNVTA